MTNIKIGCSVAIFTHPHTGVWHKGIIVQDLGAFIRIFDRDKDSSPAEAELLPKAFCSLVAEFKEPIRFII